MAGRKVKNAKRKIETYTHSGKKRSNNPPVVLVTPDTDSDLGKKKTYSYDPNLDPSLQWAERWSTYRLTYLRCPCTCMNGLIRVR